LNLATETTILNNWFAIRQSSEWDPASGNPNHHETIQILSSNSDKSRGGVGKSMVLYREAESPDSGVWTSDGILRKLIFSTKRGG
jgi:hypothetical protein